MSVGVGIEVGDSTCTETDRHVVVDYHTCFHGLMTCVDGYVHFKWVAGEEHFANGWIDAIRIVYHVSAEGDISLSVSSSSSLHCLVKVW